MEGGIPHYTIMGTLGNTGLGLVWGWLIGSLSGRLYKPARAYLSIFLVTLTIAIEVMLFLDWERLLLFLGTALFALFIHVEWRRKLIQNTNH